MNRTRRDFLKTTALGAAALAFTPGISSGQDNIAAPAAASRPKPNIVYILADDLGWADLHVYGSVYGNQTADTPNLDRLAAQGMRFTDAYAAGPVCSPTRASIMTGKYPARLHLTQYIPGNVTSNVKLLEPEWTKNFPVAEATIAGALKAAGYTTAIVGKTHLGWSFQPTKLGFDQDPLPAHPSPPLDNPLWTEQQTDAALKFIEQNKDKPFFLYLAYNAPHTGFYPRPELMEKYKSLVTGQSKYTRPSGSVTGWSPHCRADYLAIVEELDTGVGRVLAKLDELGVADNTLVIFVSDNGGIFNFNNLPLREKKFWLYEGGVRVPQIVRWPGVVAPGSTCAVPTSTVDHYPTLLDAVGTPDVAGHQSDGVSLMPLLRGTGTIDRSAIYWHFPHGNQAGAPSAGSAVRDGDWKLIEFFESERVELYNLKDDLSESKDLAATNPEKVKELRQLLNRWRESVGAQMMRSNPEWKP